MQNSNFTWAGNNIDPQITPESPQELHQPKTLPQPFSLSPYGSVYISNTQNVHFQKTVTEICLIFLPFSSLSASKMADRMGSRKTPMSLNDRHYRLLQDLSAPPKPSSKHSFGTHSFISLSLSKILFKIYSDYWILCLSQTMMVFPNSQGSPILILLHSVLLSFFLLTFFFFFHEIFWNALG